MRKGKCEHEKVKCSGSEGWQLNEVMCARRSTPHHSGPTFQNPTTGNIKPSKQRLNTQHPFPMHQSPTKSQSQKAVCPVYHLTVDINPSPPLTMTPQNTPRRTPNMHPLPQSLPLPLTPHRAHTITRRHTGRIPSSPSTTNTRNHTPRQRHLARTHDRRRRERHLTG